MKRADRSVGSSRLAGRCAGTAVETPAKSSDVSFVPLLIHNRDLSAKLRRALLEKRLRDAAVMLAREHGLSCIEAGDLLGIGAC